MIDAVQTGGDQSGELAKEVNRYVTEQAWFAPLYRLDQNYYTDPKKVTDASRYDSLSFNRVLADDLKVMDASAVALCRDNNIPIVVFNIRQAGSLPPHGQITSLAHLPPSAHPIPHQLEFTPPQLCQPVLRAFPGFSRRALRGRTDLGLDSSAH